MKKPEAKRTATPRRRSKEDEGVYSPFNLSCLRHEIDAIGRSKEKTIDLTSLSAALSAASSKIKQTDKSQRKIVKETRKKRKGKKKKKVVKIAMKPETNAELRRWLSNFDKSLKQTFKEKGNRSVVLEPQMICEFNTTMHSHSHSFF